MQEVDRFPTRQELGQHELDQIIDVSAERLRDFFAGHALTGLLFHDHLAATNANVRKSVVDSAYLIADEMMERKERIPGADY